MDDKSLLLLAAKAAGLKNFQYAESVIGKWNIYHGDPDDPRDCWNPLHDDADAFRLATHLRIETEFYGNIVYAGPRKTAKYSVAVCSDLEILDAMRVAIVHAAADIGENMP